MRAERLVWCHTKFGLQGHQGYQVRAASPALVEATRKWPWFLGHGAEGPALRGVGFATLDDRAWLVQRSNDGADITRPRQEDAWVLPAGEIDARQALALLTTTEVVADEERPEGGDRSLPPVELPVVDPGDRPPPDPVDRAAVAALLGALYDGRVPVLLVGDSDHAEGVLAAALACLPDDLAAVTTFSTGHNPATAALDTRAFDVVAVHRAPPDVTAFADVIDLERPGEHDPTDSDLSRLVAGLVVELFDPFGSGPRPTIALARSLRGTSAAQVARTLRLAEGRWSEADLVACSEAGQLDLALVDADATVAGLTLLARGEMPATPATVAALREAGTRHLVAPSAVVAPVAGVLLAPPDEATVDAFAQILAPEALGAALASALEWATGHDDPTRLPELLAAAVALAERWGCEGHITAAHRRVAALPLAELAAAVDRALGSAHSRRSLDALIDASLRWGAVEGATVKALSSDDRVERLIIDRLVVLGALPEAQERIGLLLGSLPDGGLRLAVELGHHDRLPRAVVEATFAAAEAHHDHPALAKALGKDGRRQLAALVATWCPIAALVTDQSSRRRLGKGRDEQ